MYMLDTNTVSYLIKSNRIIRQHLDRIPISRINISVITEAELRVGVAKRPEARTLAKAVDEFLARATSLAWDRDAAIAYAHLSDSCRRSGKTLSALDMLIAAHSLAVGATLVTNDLAFFQIDGLKLTNWLQEDI